jgi:hypothetical protein
MAGWTRWERERIEQLVAEGAPPWMLFRAVPHSRHAVRRYVLRLKQVPRPEPVRSPLRLSLCEREEVSRGLAGGESLRAIAGRMFGWAFVVMQTAAFAFTVALAVAVPTSSASADAPQTPVATACPTGQPLTNIQELETAQGHPYPLAELVDQTGNQNGFVCAKPHSAGETFAVCGPDCPNVLFLFRDDSIPALVNAQAG